jgi:hypothetical protein
MLAVASSPIGFQLSRSQSTSDFGTTYARNHCLPSRSGSPSATTTQRANELPDPQPKRPETRWPASTAIDCAPQQARPQSDRAAAKDFLLHLGGSGLRNDESRGRANGKTPACRAIGFGDRFQGLEKLGPTGLQSAIRAGDHHREQIGVEQCPRRTIRQASRKLRFPSLPADEVIERLGPLAGGRLAADLRVTGSLFAPQSLNCSRRWSLLAVVTASATTSSTSRSSARRS